MIIYIRHKAYSVCSYFTFQICSKLTDQKGSDLSSSAYSICEFSEVVWSLWLRWKKKLFPPLTHGAKEGDHRWKKSGWQKSSSIRWQMPVLPSHNYLSDSKTQILRAGINGVVLFYQNFFLFFLYYHFMNYCVCNIHKYIAKSSISHIQYSYGII